MSISNLLTAGLLSVAAATLTSEVPVAVLPFWGLNTIWLLHVCAHAGAVTSASPTMTTAKTQSFFCIPFVLPGLNVELHNRPTQSLVRCVASGVPKLLARPPRASASDKFPETRRCRRTSRQGCTLRLAQPPLIGGFERCANAQGGHNHQIDLGMV